MTDRVVPGTAGELSAVLLDGIVVSLASPAHSPRCSASVPTRSM
ncbi:hypothetical protein Q5425_27090 [Amycolatopsis sp. A133]|nr:hypothetical protein [Amycolatopsis sp. A133]MDQ7807419.1 hypothetical protein [Amycolatopsis sp. A133]